MLLKEVVVDLKSIVRTTAEAVPEVRLLKVIILVSGVGGVLKH